MMHSMKKLNQFSIYRQSNEDDIKSPIRTAVHPRSSHTWRMTVIAAALPSKQTLSIISVAFNVLLGRLDEDLERCTHREKDNEQE